MCAALCDVPCNPCFHHIEGCAFQDEQGTSMAWYAFPLAQKCLGILSRTRAFGLNVILWIQFVAMISQKIILAQNEINMFLKEVNAQSCTSEDFRRNLHSLSYPDAHRSVATPGDMSFPLPFPRKLIWRYIATDKAVSLDGYLQPGRLNCVDWVPQNIAKQETSTYWGCCYSTLYSTWETKYIDWTLKEIQNFLPSLRICDSTDSSLVWLE